MENTTSLFDRICGMLTGIGCKLNIVESDHAVRVGIRNDVGLFDVCFHVSEAPSILGVMVCVPMVVQEKSRVKVAGLLVRANHAWLLGHLKLDMSSGFLHWFSSMPIEDGSATERQLRCLMDADLGMMRQYLSAINRVMYGDDLSPAEAVAEVEMAAT